MARAVVVPWAPMASSTARAVGTTITLAVAQRHGRWQPVSLGKCRMPLNSQTVTMRCASIRVILPQPLYAAGELIARPGINLRSRSGRNTHVPGMYAVGYRRFIAVDEHRHIALDQNIHILTHSS